MLRPLSTSAFSPARKTSSGCTSWPHSSCPGDHSCYGWYTVGTMVLSCGLGMSGCPAVAGSQRRSPRRKQDGVDAESSEAERQARNTERQDSVNPIMLVGKGLHAGAQTLQEVPQQALGHMMGGAGSGLLSRRHLKALATAETAGNSPRRSAGNSPRRSAGSSPHRAAGNSPHRNSREGGAKSPQQRRKQKHAAAVQRNAAASVADRASQSEGQSAADQPVLHGSADTQKQADGSSGLRGWDKVRKAVKGTPILKSRAGDKRKVPSLASSSPPPAANPDTRVLKRDSSSGGSLSKNTTGPMQYMWSRGGKVAAVLAMMGTKQVEIKEGDVEEGTVPHGNEPCDTTSQGAANAPGDDPVSQAGARDPQKAAGLQVSRPLSVEAYCYPAYNVPV